ncbi:MAG: zinc ribbon domain-containing protein [Bacilli bacterium]|nr:zinc ribbon domain-containing protein [Bacilli bacterium]
MKCLKCGAYVYSSDKFCRSCGTTLNEDTCQYGDNIANSKYDSSSCHVKQYDYSTAYSNTKKDSDTKYTSSYEYDDKYTIDQSKFDYAMPTDSGGDDKYVKAYIGQNYQSIKKMKFSFPSLIFGPWYLLYRKVWGYAIGIFIISIAAAILLSSDIADIINTFINVFLAFKFQSIYMKQAEENVEQIKQQNLDKTTNELLDICRKKGGTSSKAPAIIILIAVILIPIIAMYVYTNDSVDVENENNTEIVEEVDEENNEFTYTLPQGFIKAYGSGFYNRFEYQVNNSIKCNLTIDKTTLIRNYPDEKTYLEKKMNIVANTTNKPIPVMSLNLNGKDWKYMNLETPQRSETMYAYKTDKEIYVIKTYDYKINNQSNTICKTKYNEFLNSVKIN